MIKLALTIVLVEMQHLAQNEIALSTGYWFHLDYESIAFFENNQSYRKVRIRVNDIIGADTVQEQIAGVSFAFILKLTLVVL